jgi:hypothetical protein
VKIEMNSNKKTKLFVQLFLLWRIAMDAATPSCQPSINLYCSEEIDFMEYQDEGENERKILEEYIVYSDDEEEGEIYHGQTSFVVNPTPIPIPTPTPLQNQFQQIKGVVITMCAFDLSTTSSFMLVDPNNNCDEDAVERTIEEYMGWRDHLNHSRCKLNGNTNMAYSCGIIGEPVNYIGTILSAMLPFPIGCCRGNICMWNEDGTKVNIEELYMIAISECKITKSYIVFPDDCIQKFVCYINHKTLDGLTGEICQVSDVFLGTQLLKKDYFGGINLSRLFDSCDADGDNCCTVVAKPLEYYIQTQLPYLVFSLKGSNVVSTRKSTLYITNAVILPNTFFP